MSPASKVARSAGATVVSSVTDPSAVAVSSSAVNMVDASPSSVIEPAAVSATSLLLPAVIDTTAMSPGLVRMPPREYFAALLYGVVPLSFTYSFLGATEWAKGDPWLVLALSAAIPVGLWAGRQWVCWAGCKEQAENVTLQELIGKPVAIYGIKVTEGRDDYTERGKTKGKKKKIARDEVAQKLRAEKVPVTELKSM